jgi:hypothetical protein
MPAPTLKKSSPTFTPYSARCARAVCEKRRAGTSRLGWEGSEAHRNGVALVRPRLRHAPARAIGSCASPRRGSSSRPSSPAQPLFRGSAPACVYASIAGGPFPPAHEHPLRGRVRMARRRKNGNVRTILVGRTEARSGRPKPSGTDLGGAVRVRTRHECHCAVPPHPPRRGRGPPHAYGAARPVVVLVLPTLLVRSPNGAHSYLPTHPVSLLILQPARHGAAHPGREETTGCAGRPRAPSRSPRAPIE